MKLPKLLILLKVLLLPTAVFSQPKPLEPRLEGVGSTTIPELKSTRSPLPTTLLGQEQHNLSTPIDPTQSRDAHINSIGPISKPIPPKPTPTPIMNSRKQGYGGVQEPPPPPEVLPPPPPPDAPIPPAPVFTPPVVAE